MSASIQDSLKDADHRQLKNRGIYCCLNKFRNVFLNKNF